MGRILVVVWCCLLWALPALAGDVIDRVKHQGVVRCGVGDEMPGFSVKDAEGRWSGMDVDFCRAVAAAVLGDPQKVAFQPLSSQGRFPSLLSREIDVLTRNTTWTLGREARFGVAFVGPLLFTGQGFLVRSDTDITTVAALGDARLCLVKGSVHEQGLEEWATIKGLRFTPVVCDSSAATVAALQAGQCQAATGDITVLAGLRANLPDGNTTLRLLFEDTIDEPISPVILRGDEAWLTILRAVLSALIGAEQYQLTGAALQRGDDPASNPGGRFFLSQADSLAVPLGLAPGWAARVVAAVGNYGEMYERNLGQESALRLPRRVNKPVTQGGLLFALPF